MMRPSTPPQSLRAVILAVTVSAAVSAAGLGCSGSRLRTGTTTEPKAPPPPVPVPTRVDGTCEPGLATCPGSGTGYCFDLQSAPDHCGTCENACALGSPCEHGQCRVVSCTSRISVRTTRLGAARFSYSLALADFDRDGAVDFLAPTPGSDPLAVVDSVTVFRGQGDGTFEAGASYSAGVAGDVDAGYAPIPMVATDLNRDQIPDLVVRAVAGGAATVVARLGNGDGTFGPEIGLAAGSSPLSIAAADLDGDATVDLALVSEQGTRFRVFRGNGDGTFSGPQELTVGADPRTAVTVADWNSDGIPDLVFADAYLHVVLGKGQGQFAPAVDCGLRVALVGSAKPPIMADFDRDGVVDVLNGNTVLFGIRDCNATRQASYPAFHNVSIPLTAGDLNGDGLPDLAFDSDDGSEGLPAVSYLPSDGRGGFGAPVVLGNSWSPQDKYSGHNPNGFVADVNGDGRLDLLIANQSSVIVFLNTCQ